MSFFLALTGCDLFESAIPDLPVDVDVLDHPSDAPADPVGAWDLPITVDSATPFVSPPASADLGALLFLDALARQGGADGAAVLSLTDLTATGSPFTLNVALGGGPLLATEPGAPSPVSPPECAIPVDPASLDATAHAAALLDCFRAWVDANGAPGEPTASFSIATRAATVEYSGTLHLEADENVELGCEYANELPDDVTSNPDAYKIKDLHIGGFVGAVDFGMLAWGWVMVYDASDTLAATAIGSFDVAAASGVYIGEEIAVSDPAAASLAIAGAPVDPLYSPPDGWNDAVYPAMLGDGTATGRADACWGSLHQDVPNRTIVSWTLLGSASPQL